LCASFGHKPDILALPVRKAAVLMYHQINPRPVHPGTITPLLFSQHLDILQKKGYHIISLEQYTDYLEGNSDIPDKSAAITFDDGYESFYKYAYPELVKRHLKATNFVIVGAVGSRNQAVPLLEWPQIKEMQANGISFYPHSYNSHYLAGIYPDLRLKSCLSGRIWLTPKHRFETETEYKNRLSGDLFKAKKIMEQKLGRPMLHFAWPYGQASEEALRAARLAGYRYIYYVDNASLSNDSILFYIPRKNAGNMNISPSVLDSALQSIFARPAAFNPFLGIKFCNIFTSIFLFA